MVDLGDEFLFFRVPTQVLEKSYDWWHDASDEEVIVDKEDLPHC